MSGRILWFPVVEHLGVRSGDLLVVNTSATNPAAVDGTSGGSAVRVHFSTLLPGDLWLIELRTPAGISSTPWPADASGTRVLLDGGATLEVLARFSTSQRLYFTKLCLPDGQRFDAYLARYGRPIRYHYVTRDWPIATYQTSSPPNPAAPRCPAPRALSQRRSSASWLPAGRHRPIRVAHRGVIRRGSRTALPGALPRWNRYR